MSQNTHNTQANQASQLSRFEQMSMSSVGGRQTPYKSRRFVSQSQTSGQRYITQQSSFVQSPQTNIIHETQSEMSEAFNQSVIYGTDIILAETRKKFEEFLINFKLIIKKDKRPGQMMIESQDDEEVFIYREQLNQIRETQQTLVRIDGDHLFQFNQKLYHQLIRFPAEIIVIFDEVVQKVFQEKVANSEEDKIFSQKLLVGIENLRQTTQLRDLEVNQLCKLVQIRGIIIRCSDVVPEMKEATFRCDVCGNIERKVVERGRVEEPKECQKCKFKHVYQIIHNQCQFTDKQYVKIQESPENMPDGDTPQTLALIAYDDNVDFVKPGDRVEVVGILRINGIRRNKNKRVIKAVYNTYLDVISYIKLNKKRFNLLDDDQSQEEKIFFPNETKQKLFQFGDNENILEILKNSFAPSIWEYHDVKLGILCQLFGGTPKDFSQAGKGRFRDQINCLLVGDPSVAKSQLLQYVHKIAPRGIYTSGKGSSAVGLTVHVKKDPETRELILESGALVLSDLGICCIDEFDKMDDSTRSILHEAMEQQTISVAKAGIVAQLNARTAILAGANPVQSRYNPRKSVVENINLPPSLLSRFDFIYIMLDQADPNRDAYLASHIINLYTDTSKHVGYQDQAQQPQQTEMQEEPKQISSHKKKKALKKGIRLSQQSQKEDEEMPEQLPLMDKETLAQYITFARQEIKPKLSAQIVEKLVKGYVEMRKLGSSRNTITCTPRQLESIIRISEAIAKMKLRPEVLEDDVDEAMRLIKVATQQAATDPTTGLIDMDMLATGVSAVSRQKILRIIEILKELVRANHSYFMGSGMAFQSLLDEVQKKMNSEEDQGVNDEELRAALRSLAEEHIVMLAGSSKTPYVRVSNMQIV